MAAMLQHQQQNIYHSDVMTVMSRDAPCHVPRDVMTTNSMEKSNYLLQPSFYDVTDTPQLQDAWMITSSLMTSCAADDSGVSLSQSVNNDDEWILGIFPENPNYNVIAENVTEETHTSAKCSRYDVIKHINVETPVVESPGWLSGISAGHPSDDVSSLRFTDEQIVCICLALQQKQDFDKLEEFLSTLSLQPDFAYQSQITYSSRETCEDNILPLTSHLGTSVVKSESSDVADAVLSSVAHVAFHRGRYQQLYHVLQSHSFSQVYHRRLQQLWYDAHYAAETAVRRRSLGAVDKYRIRRKHPLPATIWDGEDTVYCFKVCQVVNTLSVSIDCYNYSYIQSRRFVQISMSVMSVTSVKP